MGLVIKNLTVGYANDSILHDVSFEVSAGEILALIGPNGAGKSTLIRALSGVLPVQEGDVLHDDENLLALGEVERAQRIAVVPQATQLGGAFTVGQTVLLGRTPYMGWLGNPSEKDYAVVQSVLEQTDLIGFQYRRIAELSGGEQQRVLLARALAQEADILLLDEPTNHLDLRYQSVLLSTIRSLAKDQNLAIIIALHDLNQVTLVADRVLLLKEGQILRVGNPADVLEVNTLNEAYGASFQMIRHPETQAPIILPNL